MQHYLLLLFITIYAFVSRLWLIDRIPPLIIPSFFSLRLISAFLSIGSIILVYFYVKSLYKGQRLALISSWVFTLLPWTTEQGRMVSQVNNALFVLLVFLILVRKVERIHLKILFFVLCSLFFVLFYPQFWLFRTNQFIPPISICINNFFYLISPEFLFFKNPTFWWGGVREVGVMYLSFSPFLLLGIYEMVKKRKWNILFWFLMILFISSASPFFPESREFFFATPFISIIIALGIYQLFSQKRKGAKIIFSVIFLLTLYDIAQFWHYYTIHYPQQIISNLSQIHEPF